MIWAKVSSQSCFCWLYRASPSLAAKNIINLISVLTIWWCPCIEFSCVIGRGCLLWPVHSLCKTLLAFALLYSIFQGQICLLFQEFLDFLLLCPRSGGCAGAAGPRGAIPRWRSGRAEVRQYSSSKVRSSGCALLEHPWRDTPCPR